MTFVLIWWVIGARKWFRGPKINIAFVPITAIDPETGRRGPSTNMSLGIDATKTTISEGSSDNEKTPLPSPK